MVAHPAARRRRPALALLLASAIPTSALDCPAGCSGHGVCLDGVCECYVGFTNYDCSLKTCPGACSGNGLCYDGQCYCKQGFSGARCHLPSDYAYCEGGHPGFIRGCGQGKCVPDGSGQPGAGKCACDPGYAGELCEEEEALWVVCPDGAEQPVESARRFATEVWFVCTCTRDDDQCSRARAR